MTQQSELVHVTTQQVNGSTYDVYAMPGGKLLAVPRTQQLENAYAQHPSNVVSLPQLPEAAPHVYPNVVSYTPQPSPVYPTMPQSPSTALPPTNYAPDRLPIYILLGLASMLVFGLVALMLKPVQPSPPPRYPTYERTCQPAGFMGWGETCSERRGYEY